MQLSLLCKSGHPSKTLKTACKQMDTIPPRIFALILIHTYPFLCLAINITAIHPSPLAFLLAIFSSLSKTALDYYSTGSVIICTICNLFYITYALLLQYYYFISKEADFTKLTYLYFIAFGFVSNSAHSTKYMLTVDCTRAVYHIQLFGYLISTCLDFTILIYINILLLIGTIVCVMLCESMTIEYTDTKEIYEVLKERIEDEKARTKEYKAILKNREETKEEKDIEFDWIKYASNIRVSTVLFLLSRNRLNYLLCSMVNLAFDFDTKYVEFVVTSCILLEMNWEPLIVFYRGFGSGSNVGEFVIGFVTYLILTILGI
ncbi:hypothetical protein ECANGB1_1868 [Enterospora canceri]|uniref:Uncharacterized protein n=1 Tax=Enterospora canceri TaxID=1081671 RepID=A0A1Y1S5D9_9MICR|nr:hypothetical protein ECANGB1_1868 [Enterospora canceri]